MTDTANLEDGYYWVRIGKGWEVVDHRGGMFWRIADVETWYVGNFDEIYPRPIKREE